MLDHIRRFIVASYIRQYLETLYGGTSKVSFLYPSGRDPAKFWNWDGTFSYVPDRQTFRRILHDIGVRPGDSIVHPYALDRQYIDMLKECGARVDAYDLSLRSVQRSGAKLADAERLVDYADKNYNHLIAFEPTSFFRTLFGDPIRGILFLASAANVANHIHILFHQLGGTRGVPASDFLPFFSWLKRNFGANVVVRKYPVASGDLYVVSASVPPKRRGEILDFARYVHRSAVMGFPKAYVTMFRKASVVSETGKTYENHIHFLDQHADRAVRLMSRTRRGRHAIRLLAQL